MAVLAPPKPAVSIPRSIAAPKRAELPLWAAVPAGAALALSAPGFDQWYLAWVGLIPLLAGIFLTKSWRSAIVFAGLFGGAYTLTHVHWMLTLRPFMGLGGPQNVVATAILYLTICVVHQGILFAIFAGFARTILGVLKLDFRRNTLAWTIVGSIVLPLLWVFLFNKIGNSSVVWGMPWTVLEYSQYRQTSFIQIAQVIGGIGIGAFIVFVNVNLFSSICGKLRYNLPPLFAVLTAILMFGSIVVNKVSEGEPRSSLISLVQANANEETKVDEAAGRNLQLSLSAPQGICIWPEWALSVDLPNFPELTARIEQVVSRERQDWLIGSTEGPDRQHRYNVACAFTPGEGFLHPVYRKRMLVPFGEYRPWLVNELYRAVDPRTPPYVGTLAGTNGVVYKLSRGTVAPLLCLEILYPELTAEAVRNGAEGLVDLSSLVWFTSPTVGKHLIAASVLRAVETSRSVAYATIGGPSAIIDAHGRILVQTPANRKLLVSREMEFHSELTPFARWFR